MKDLVILGGGPGGYVAALRAATLGMSVVLIEGGHLGGACLNWGCIPTKSLYHSVEVLELARRGGEFGVRVTGVEPDFSQMQERKEEIVGRLRKGVGFLLKKRGVEVVSGWARILGPGRVGVGEEEIQAKTIIIATGSRPWELPGVRIDGQTVLGAKELLELNEVPARLTIIGGGVIGVEFASIFASLGSEVTIIEGEKDLLPMMDSEISRTLKREFSKRGIRMMTEQLVREVRQGHLVLASGEEMEVEKVLLAVGTAPNTEGLGLEDLGIATNARGEIVISEMGETSVPRIFAIGDVTDYGMKLAHTASAWGLRVVHHLMGEEHPVRRDAIPSAVFTHPEVATVGLTEAGALEEGLEIQIGKFSFQAAGKAMAMGETQGFVKVIAAKESGQVLGVHIIGPGASDLIAEATVAITHGLTLADIADVIHTHPTLPEAFHEAVEAARGMGIHSL